MSLASARSVGSLGRSDTSGVGSEADCQDHLPLPQQPSYDNPRYLAGREHIYEGMRKAGVPEG